MVDNELFLAPNFTRQDWVDLNLTLRSTETDWDKAIEIFNNRIDGWYFAPIRLLSDDYFKNGFSIMAICCLLIDTFKQFQDGELTSDPNDYIEKSETKYEKFLYTCLRDVFNRQTARIFYKSIRCGILHSAQTKKDAILSKSSDYIIIFDGNKLYVSVEKLVERLTTYYKEYLKQLHNKHNTLVRTSFLKKMNNIASK